MTQVDLKAPDHQGDSTLGEVLLKMSKLFDWRAEEIVNKAWELAREDKERYANQGADLLDKVKEGISGLSQEFSGVQ